nr:hypothetical protein [Candidatus Krumholzibacteriota bacterium]
ALYPPGKAGEVDRFALRREGVWVIDSARSVKTRLGGGNFFWIEDLKGRAINGCAGLTPLLKRYFL